MKLTPRDLDIIRTIFEVQFLTIDQITRLFFCSPKTCRNRLLFLRRAGWLEEERPRRFAAPHFSILKLGKMSFKHFRYPSSKAASTQYLEHRLELNDLYVHLRSKGVLADLNLCWQDGANFIIPYEKTHFRPDARMIGKSDNMIYLEYDRGTKNLPIIQENLSKYLEWFDEKERRAGITKMHLIYVTPKNSRALAIQRQFEAVLLKQNRMVSQHFLFHSFTTETFLEQSKMILSLGQLPLVTGCYRQNNQMLF